MILYIRNLPFQIELCLLKKLLNVGTKGQRKIYAAFYHFKKKIISLFNLTIVHGLKKKTTPIFDVIIMLNVKYL